MKTSPRALQFIRDQEGLRLRAYVCPSGRLTIGYGHTSDAANPVKRDQIIDNHEAEVLLAGDVLEAEDCIDRVVKVPLNGNEYGALVSFIFNVGASAFTGSTLAKLLNAADYAGAARQFGLWVKGDQPRRTLPGLVRRRASETALFTTPPELENLPAPAPPITGVTQETQEARDVKQDVGPVTPGVLGPVACVGTLGMMLMAAISNEPYVMIGAGASAFALLGIALYSWHCHLTE